MQERVFKGDSETKLKWRSKFGNAFPCSPNITFLVKLSNSNSFWTAMVGRCRKFATTSETGFRKAKLWVYCQRLKLQGARSPPCNKAASVAAATQHAECWRHCSYRQQWRVFRRYAYFVCTRRRFIGLSYCQSNNSLALNSLAGSFN